MLACTPNSSKSTPHFTASCWPVHQTPARVPHISLHHVGLYTKLQQEYPTFHCIMLACTPNSSKSTPHFTASCWPVHQTPARVPHISLHHVGLYTKLQQEYPTFHCIMLACTPNSSKSTPHFTASCWPVHQTPARAPHISLHHVGLYTKLQQEYPTFHCIMLACTPNSSKSTPHFTASCWPVHQTPARVPHISLHHVGLYTKLQQEYPTFHCIMLACTPNSIKSTPHFTASCWPVHQTPARVPHISLHHVGLYTKLQQEYPTFHCIMLACTPNSSKSTPHFTASCWPVHQTPARVPHISLHHVGLYTKLQQEYPTFHCIMLACTPNSSKSTPHFTAINYFIHDLAITALVAACKQTGKKGIHCKH
ncbi:hypothetical protein ACOMHN_010880 [Nucella lapillus]